MSPLYTRTGDDGMTGLLGPGRVPKNHPRIETLGAIDEASAALGLARAFCQVDLAKGLLMDVQRDLYSLMTEVAATRDQANCFSKLGAARLKWLEDQIDSLSKTVPVPGEFILPGDSLSGAALSLARTIIRRAERYVAGLLDAGEIDDHVILQYLNRLSSLCFVLELLENQHSGGKTTLAKE